MKAGAARNAVDCALWDLDAKKAGARAFTLAGIAEPAPLTTAYTISLGEPEAMAAQTAQYAHRALLKVKVGTADDASRIRAVRAAAPNSAIILDANEGWTETNLAYHFAVCAESGVALIEQPLPAGHDALLSSVHRPVPVCADESVHKTEDLPKLAGLYDAVNIKLDKTGGLTEALRMRDAARALNLKIMVGCMVGTSLGMAPAVLLAQGADFVDLDGPLLAGPRSRARSALRGFAGLPASSRPLGLKIPGGKGGTAADKGNDRHRIEAVNTEPGVEIAGCEGEDRREHAGIEEIQALRRGFLLFGNALYQNVLHARMHDRIGEGVETL
jgi:hypothetical protein